ncbi:hypothetical protein [Actinomadura nitritigenes]
MIAVWASAMCAVAVLAASVRAFAMEQRRPRAAVEMKRAIEASAG